MAVFGSFVGMVVLLSVVFALLIPIALIWLFVEVARGLSGERRRPRRDAAVEALRYRYARGEITEAEFERAMWDLGYERVR